MADNIKVQGNIDKCLNTLQYYANTYRVSYKAYFNSSKTQLIHPENVQSTRTVPIYFQWRYEYKEYDNSV